MLVWSWHLSVFTSSENATRKMVLWDSGQVIWFQRTNTQSPGMEKSQMLNVRKWFLLSRHLPGRCFLSS